MSDRPDIQLIANVVAHDGADGIAFVRYGEPDGPWWLPGKDLEPFDHPEETARTALAELTGLDVTSMTLGNVESFRGRRGWHISFDYLVLASGSPDPASEVPWRWFPRSDMPVTKHGAWEHEMVERLRPLGGG